MSSLNENGGIDEKIRQIKKSFRDMRNEFDIVLQLNDQLDQIILDLKKIKQNAKATSKFINQYECEIVEYEETDQSSPQESIPSQMGDEEQMS